MLTWELTNPSFRGLPRGNTQLCLVHRRLTSRQQSLILSYAEDETDVEGTVNGVTNTSTGKAARQHAEVLSVVGGCTVQEHVGVSACGEHGRKGSCELGRAECQPRS